MGQGCFRVPCASATREWTRCTLSYPPVTLPLTISSPKSKPMAMAANPTRLHLPPPVCAPLHGGHPRRDPVPSFLWSWWIGNLFCDEVSARLFAMPCDSAPDLLVKGVFFIVILVNLIYVYGDPSCDLALPSSI